jgi:hypothetical protein
MPYCGNCGNQLSDLAVACPKCGSPTARGLAQPVTPGLSREYRSAPVLRPLGVGEIIDRAIKVYGRNAAALLGIVAIFVVPLQVLSGLILASAWPSSVTGLLSQTRPLQQPANLSLVAGDFRRFAAAIFVVSILTLLAQQLATAACLRTVSEAYLGERPDWRESVAFAFRRLGRLLLFFLCLALLAIPFGLGLLIVSFIVSLVVRGIGGALLLTVLVLVLYAWIGVSLYISIPVVLLEDVGPFEAMARSFRLVRGKFWHTFGVLVVSLLVTFVAYFVFQLGFGLLIRAGHSVTGLFVQSTLVLSISGVLITPFLAAVVAILYIDLRVRKEGFDLELLAQRVGRTDLVPAAAPPATFQGPARRTPARRPGFVQEDDPAGAGGTPAPPARRRPAPRRPGFVPEDEEDGNDAPPPAPKKTAPRKPVARKPVAPQPAPDLDLGSDEPDEPPPPPKRTPRKPSAPRKPTAPRRPPPDDFPEDPEFGHS